MSRRAMLRSAAILVVVLAGCNEPMAPPSDAELGLLSARPHSPAGTLFQPGSHVLDLDLDRNPVVYVPQGYDPDIPAPIVVLFHGAGGSAQNWVSPYGHADRLGLVLLIMQSRGPTWDLVYGGLGPDVAATDRALEVVFDRCAIDPGSVAFAGFSDGASYTLSLGLRNPELVRHLIGFSPGFETGDRLEPKPRVFLSHGASDPVLPVQRSQSMVQQLLGAGYDVTYREFNGGHEVPGEISTAAFDWLVEGELDVRP
ncbi:MAG: alpha/beta hydrolase [Candidatus Longimicrobiales bacterium M2_2A_002]